MSPVSRASKTHLIIPFRCSNTSFISFDLQHGHSSFQWSESNILNQRTQWELFKHHWTSTRSNKNLNRRIKKTAHDNGNMPGYLQTMKAQVWWIGAAVCFYVNNHFFLWLQKQTAERLTFGHFGPSNTSRGISIFYALLFDNKALKAKLGQVSVYSLRPQVPRLFYHLVTDTGSQPQVDC